MKTIRIVIADDHPLFREALRGGYDVLERRPAASPATRTLIFTGYLERKFEEKALAARAKGFLGKDAPAQVIIRAVRAVPPSCRFCSGKP